MGSAQHPLVEELREGLVEGPGSATCLPDVDGTCMERTPEVSGLSGHQERWKLCCAGPLGLLARGGHQALGAYRVDQQAWELRMPEDGVRHPPCFEAPQARSSDLPS